MLNNLLIFLSYINLLKNLFHIKTMKFFWPILLVCIIFCQAKPDKKKVAKGLQLMKRYSQLTELERKLEDITDVPTDDEGSNNSTNISASDAPITINESYARQKMNRTTNNPNADYQIKKFYGFRQEEGASLFYFNMLFSFMRQTIGRLIIMRLRIIYSSTRLRNLDEALAESVPSTCTIGDSSIVGNVGKGEEIDYSCSAPKKSGKLVSNINLDTTIPMIIDGKEVDFDDVNFSEEAAEQADNIAAATGGKDSGSNVYRKSSSGLSGGAIAGIVIACVVVLIAAAVAAIMLRKPSPPIENTTVVDLK